MAKSTKEALRGLSGWKELCEVVPMEALQKGYKTLRVFCRYDDSEKSNGVPRVIPIGSMYGIYIYIWLIFIYFYDKCRWIYHTWILWDLRNRSIFRFFCVSCFLAGCPARMRENSLLAFERFWYGIVLLVLYWNHLRGGSVPLYSWR